MLTPDGRARLARAVPVYTAATDELLAPLPTCDTTRLHTLCRALTRQQPTPQG